MTDNSNIVLGALQFWVDNGVLKELEGQLFESRPTRSKA